MNYLAEILAFYDWLESNRMSTSAVALWHALMAINNKCKWESEFPASIDMLKWRTGCGKDAIYSARNTLRQKGRITFTDKNGSQSARYHIIPFVSVKPTQTPTQPPTQTPTLLPTLPPTQPPTQTPTQTPSTPYIDKHKHKRNKTSSSGAGKPGADEDESDEEELENSLLSEFKRTFAYEPSESERSKLRKYLARGVEPKLITLAFDRAREYDARHFGYVTAILDSAIAQCAYTADDYTELTEGATGPVSTAPPMTAEEARKRIADGIAKWNEQLEQELRSMELAGVTR